MHGGAVAMSAVWTTAVRDIVRKLRWQGRSLARCLSRDIGQPSHFSHHQLLAENEVLPGMHKTEFAQRRNNLMEQIGRSDAGMSHDKHVIIIPGSPIKYMSADVPYKFHQHPDVTYLCGLLEPDCVLVLASDNKTLTQHTAILFLRPRDPYRELWDGPRLGVEDATDFTGVDEAYSIDELGQHLEKRYSSEGYCVWYSAETPPTHPTHADVIINSLAQSRVKEVRNPDRDLALLRLVKSPSELALMRCAGTLAGYAFKAVMQASHADIGEAQLESIFEHSVKMNGAQWLSFPPVVAGGNRANSLHYITNNNSVRAGELVLMDAGCEYYGYVSDITRTWPISGQFSPAQEDLYEVVMETKKDLTRMCRPGVTLNYLHSNAHEMMASKLKRLGILPKSWSTSQLSQAMNTLFPHHIGHWLGLDTHDTMAIDRNTVLGPGMVITIEPGLYFSHAIASSLATPAAKELAGTGVRLEDNVMVTNGKAEVLNKDCPEAIEQLTTLIGQHQVI